MVSDIISFFSHIAYKLLRLTLMFIQQAGPEGGKIQLHFEEMLKSNTSLFVVSEHSIFKKLDFIQTYAEFLRFY